MLKNYLTSVFRYVSKNKAFTLINVSGLAIGMVACMQIVEFVVHEFSYDTFLEHKEQIFRVQLDRYNKGEITTRWASGCAGIGPDLKAEFPEVKYYTRMTWGNAMLSHGDVFFKEDNVKFATEDFFKVFSIKMLQGDRETALKAPYKMVMSRSMAKKYFGAENPLGKVIRNNGKTDYEITGIFEDLPDNSHMAIDGLFSFTTFQAMNNNDPMTTWQWDGFTTYIMLDDKADPKAFEAKLPAFVQKKMGKELKEGNEDMVFHLQPVSSIHLDSDFIGEFKANGNRQSVYFLSIVAILILFIAWINYINLSTAKAIERAREVGVRKVMGSFRSQLVQQFMLEALVLNATAVFIAVGFVLLLTPWFSELTGRPLGYVLFQQGAFWFGIGGLILGGALLSGLYPAFVLSSYKPVEVLKGRFKNTSRGVYFRKGMVITQFVASITLIVGTFTVYRQLRYMQEQKLGVNIDQTLVLNSPSVVDSTYQQKFQVFKQALLQFPEVSFVTASTSVPGTQPGWNAGGIRRLSQREDEANQYRVIMMDHDFIKAYGLEMVSGRPFSGDVVNEYESVILNESAVSLMGFSKPEEALNDHIYFWGDTFKIVGVVKNYHQESLKKAFDPLVFRYNKSPGGSYSIKFNTANVKTSMANFEEQWKAVFPGNPFISFFLDDHYNQQYKSDQQFGRIFGIFSTLAIFIACLGLFGLSSLTAIQRTKEIGVRKVHGASVPHIIFLLYKDVMYLILIAAVIIVPLAYYVIQEWMGNFAYQTSLNVFTFVVVALMALVFSFFTVAFHSLKTARMNPVNALKYE